jgi:PBP1b-binding outer membrane lipoprotein LpoB
VTPGPADTDTITKGKNVKTLPVRPLMFAALATAAALSACSRSEPEQPAPTNEVMPTETPTFEPTDQPSAEPTAIEQPIVNDTVALPPEEAAAPDEQMLDDASATGMTARTQRDEAQKQ